MAFQLDSNIPLMGRGVDVAGSIRDGVKTSSMIEQLRQSKEEAPIRKDILSQILAQKGQEFNSGAVSQIQDEQLFANSQDDRAIALEALKKKEQADAMAAQKEAENKNIKSIATTYSSVKGLVDSGKFNDAADALEANREVLIQAGATDLRDTDEAIEALRSGDPARIKNIKNLGEQAINIAESRGLLGDSDEKFSATTTSLAGGITVQTTSSGRKVVTDAGGNVLTGEDAVNAIKAAEDAKSQRAVDVTEGKERAKLEVKKELLPSIRADIKRAEKDAQSKGESLSELSSARAAMPGLRTVVNNLKALSSDATFTLAGKAFNTVAKELGFSTKGDTARSAMIAMVDNQVLPLLKPIFGAAFTAAEGDRLRNAFLNPDSTPDSRVASLNAFLEQMERNIETKEREAGGAAQQGQQDTGITEEEFRNMSPQQRAEVIRQLQQGK
jgi:hypothetical protein